jgi:hypothetical protein
MASISSSSFTYNVFLSFRGQDIRHGFIMAISTPSLMMRNFKEGNILCHHFSKNYALGLESRLLKVTSLLDVESDGVYVVGIHGIG